ncbi:MAG: dihydrodipicolinate synthase family protein [Planctomycetes bacterium]|nr:dihydrodipicolinate synthase family protein [Planctomycetota bacterium]
MKIDGIMPPIPTPFVDDEVAYDKLQENIEKWNKTDLSGFVIYGSNGESAYLTREEKLKIAKTAKACIATDKKMIVGTGSDSLKDTISLTNEAAALGADAALILTPNYYKPQMKHDAFIRFYTAVADATDIPVLIYDVPKFSGVHIEPAAVIELSQHPNIVGVKCSAGNVAEISEIAHRSAEGFATLVGTASVIYAGLCVGGAGGILALAVVAPEASVAIYESVKAGDHEKALKLQMQFLMTDRAVTAKFGIPGLKAALDRLDYYGGPVRNPLGSLNENQLSALDKILREAGMIE